MSLRELASALNYDQSSLSKIERNELLAPPNLIEAMAKKLGVSVKELTIAYESERIYDLLKQSDYARESLKLAKKKLENKREETQLESAKTRLLYQLKKYLARQPIDKAWMFGSFARNDESSDSDIDLLVKFKKPNKLDLLDYIGIKQDLEQLSGRKVDLVEDGYLLPGVKENIEKDKVLIYERRAG